MTPNLVFVSCPTTNCGGQWLPADKVQQLRESHETFYCPSGHSQYFGAESEKEKLNRRIVELEKKVNGLQLCPLCCSMQYKFDREGHLRREHGAYTKHQKQRKRA